VILKDDLDNGLYLHARGKSYFKIFTEASHGNSCFNKTRL